MKNHGTKNMWRWWCGGGVIAVALVLGCASAVEFKESKREAGSKTEPQPIASGTIVKRGIAADRGHDYPHNGGKASMPVEVVFENNSKMSEHINRESTLVILITGGDKISPIRGSIEGKGGLERRVSQQLTFSELGSGETQRVEVRVPAVSGSLIVYLEGFVNGGPTSAALELKINPKAISASSVQPGGITPTQAGDMGKAQEKDATGQVVQPMKAREN